MGDCFSHDEKDIIGVSHFSDVENCSRTPPRLRSEQILRFLKSAQIDPVIGKYFRNLNDFKIEELSERICAMLNYAFKCQTITSFEDVLKMHTTMGISEMDVEVFLDLLREECFHMQSRETAVQKRIFKRMKLFIVHGVKNKVRLSIGGKVVWGSLGKVKHFFPLVQRNRILKRFFVNVSESQMDHMIGVLDNLLSAPCVKQETLVDLGETHNHLYISGVEFDKFIMLWIREHQKDVHFLTRAMPTIDKLRNHFVMADERKVLDFCHMLKISRVLSSRFQGFTEHKMRSLCAATYKYLETAKKDIYNRQHLDLADLLLQMTDGEIIEFQKICALINQKTQNSAALSKCLKIVTTARC